MDSTAVVNLKADTVVLDLESDTTNINRVSVKRRDVGAATMGKSTPSKNSYYKKDTIPKLHDPGTAALLAIIPGGGQIYNKKWWKLPIVYGGLGASGYCIYHFASRMVKYQNEYYFRLLAKNNPSVKPYFDPELANIADANLLALKNDYRRNTEISAGVCVIFYALTIIDAVVDAHLFYFDISDDLSLKIEPSVDNMYGTNSFSTGLALKLTIK